MREITLSEIERPRAADDAAGETFHMDEESFRAFYESTARPLLSYLCRVAGDSALADDLLQESYYRFLRSPLPEMTAAHRKNYLFRIATNLLRDHWRRRKGKAVPPSEGLEEAESPSGELARVHRLSDLSRAFERLNPRERELLWLAYVEGSSHKEIAELTGLKAESVRTMLFRARQKLAGLLRRRGFAPGNHPA